MSQVGWIGISYGCRLSGLACCQLNEVIIKDFLRELWVLEWSITKRRCIYLGSLEGRYENPCGIVLIIFYNISFSYPIFLYWLPVVVKLFRSSTVLPTTLYTLLYCWSLSGCNYANTIKCAFIMRAIFQKIFLYCSGYMIGGPTTVGRWLLVVRCFNQPGSCIVRSTWQAQGEWRKLTRWCEFSTFYGIHLITVFSSSSSPWSVTSHAMSLTKCRK